jgi:hypothetical protein
MTYHCYGLLLNLFVKIALLSSTEFLVTTRNLFESDLLGDDEVWDEYMVSQIPLESDEIALEYLAKFNYDIEKALLIYCCQLIY